MSEYVSEFEQLCDNGVRVQTVEYVDGVHETIVTWRGRVLNICTNPSGFLAGLIHGQWLQAWAWASEGNLLDESQEAGELDGCERWKPHSSAPGHRCVTAVRELNRGERAELIAACSPMGTPDAVALETSDGGSLIVSRAFARKFQKTEKPPSSREGEGG